MLRRPPTTLTITSEDIAAYEDRRAREAQQKAVQARQVRQAQRAQLHQQMQMAAAQRGERRRTLDRGVMGTDEDTPAAPAAAARIMGGAQGMGGRQLGRGGRLGLEAQSTMMPAQPQQVSIPQPALGALGQGSGGGLGLPMTRAPMSTPEVDDDSGIPGLGGMNDMDMESDDSGPEDSMLEAQQRQQQQRAAAAAGRARVTTRQGTPPPGMGRMTRSRDERLGVGPGGRRR